MNGLKLIGSYSARLVLREWRRFVLSFLSLFITATVLSLILLLTAAGSLLLSEQSRELQGGDVILESSTPVDSAAFWQSVDLQPERESKQLSFSGTLQSQDNTTPFSLQVVDEAFPLYGEVILADAIYRPLGQNEILLDANGAKKLAVAVGDTVTFGETSYVLMGIIEAEPTSLFGGFRFLPKAIISQEGFALALVDPKLLRAEYRYAAKFSNLTSTEKIKIREVAEVFDKNLDLDIAGEERRGLQFGLQIVTNFLVVAVLITSVLAAVNVYASTIYLVAMERKSLAILLAIGLRKRMLVGMLGSALLYVVFLASILGALCGLFVFTRLGDFIAQKYFITLPNPDFLLYSLINILLILTIAVASFVPAVKKSLSLNPKQILIGGEELDAKSISLRNIATLTLSTLLPLFILAAFLLQSFTQGIIVVLAITLVYLLVAAAFSFVLSFVYKRRNNFSFFIRSIIAQKKADGLFGIVSFASLFVALTALGTLALLQISIERYLTEDLSRSVPSTYIIDVQPSQKAEIIANFPEIKLFSNIGARIIAIDTVRIQEAIAQPDSTIDRELGREFNLTSRQQLLESEEIVAGVWSEGRKGEISVDEDFAKRADIKLGSTLEFSIQGFPVQGKVTSLRKTDSRSGLPFFYFVLSPEDIGSFPSVYFGYTYYEPEMRDKLGRFLAIEMPNVSVIETADIGPLIIKLVKTLMLLILVVTLPPLLIATLLIATLIISSYSARQREGARMRALGATRQGVLRQYLFETVSLTLVSAILAYLLSTAVALAVSLYFLGLDASAVFDGQLLLGLGLIVLFVGLIGFYLFKIDTKPLRELLSYESNS